MILSMTGFGDAQHTEQGVMYGLEIRSLNNRYLKTVIKLPEHLQSLEADVEKFLRNRVGRGSITFTLRVRDTTADAAYELNTAALESYLAEMRKLTQQDGVTVDLGSMLALPGVCQPKDFSEEERGREWAIVEQLATAALDKLIEMRRREGQALSKDLLTHTAAIREHLGALAGLTPRVVEEYHKRLRERVATLMGRAALELEADTLAKEVALFAERCDIAEEISRLTSHLDQFDALCGSKEPAGRKLEFLAQELLREANTIGSKANDLEIARHIVEIKGRIDRLKEQVQNAE